MRALLLAVAWLGCKSSDPTYPDAAPAADADLTTDAAPARQTITATQPLQPGELVEGIMHGGSADIAQLHLVAPNDKLDWNIHSHTTGHAVTVYEELGKHAVDYRFVPPGDGDWYLLIRNGGPVNIDVQVEVKLYGAMTWEWQ